MLKQDIHFATSLASNGKDLDCEIQKRTRELIKDFPNLDPFLIAIAQSLIWTNHAVDKENYFRKALDFLNSGSDKSLSGLSKCFGRYGLESLNATLFNWRKLYGEFNAPLDILKSPLEEVILFQQTSLKIACVARKNRRVMHIGAWLFCAPFKMILCLRDDLWKHDRINEVLMPLGLEVVRGVKKMMRGHYSYAQYVDTGDLSEEEGDIIEGLGTVQIVQAMCKTIAKDADSNVLHINSGLWKFGRGEF
ncbi:hypothetical protein ACFL2J_01995 [Candidatus Omnitrophota bacterium]